MILHSEMDKNNSGGYDTAPLNIVSNESENKDEEGNQIVCADTDTKNYEDNNVGNNNKTIEAVENEKVASTDENVSCVDGLTSAKFKKNDMIRYKEDGKWVEAKLISRAGKVGGKYESWWNIKNLETGHEQAEDLDTKLFVERIVSDGVTNQENVVYVVQIPRYRHHEKACKDAKLKEIASWDDFEVYEEAVDDGQTRLDTHWVLTEKQVKGKLIIKARLTIRGDQEETENIRSDSPTVRKGNIKVFAAVAAKERWEICTSDVTSAFLQGAKLERDVFVLPPKERRVPGILWKLRKPVYGLVDAPRGWYLALDKKLIKSGCTKCTLDPAMYLQFSKNGNNEKVLSGIALTHVDDILHGGDESFKRVMCEVKSSFKFGTDEEEEFRYVGMHMCQTNGGIMIDQDHYVQSIEVPDMQIAEGLLMNDILDEEGQKMFRSHVARVLHVGYQSRPDVCFEAKTLSSKYGKATKADLKVLLKMTKKLPGSTTKMFFPNLGKIDDWMLVGYGDAGIKSMPDKLSSVGGQVILLANTNTNLACALSWRSKKLVRKVVSSLAGEALAVVAAIGEIVYNKSILKQIFGKGIDSIPIIIFTDSKNLYESVHSSNLVDDAWLITDISIIKDALNDGTITCLKRVSGEQMLANCLTKFGASGDRLIELLQTGRYVLPPGLV